MSDLIAIAIAVLFLVVAGQMLAARIRRLERRLDALERRIPGPSLIGGVDPALMFDPDAVCAPWSRANPPRPPDKPSTPLGSD